MKNLSHTSKTGESNYRRLAHSVEFTEKNGMALSLVNIPVKGHMQSQPQSL
jgi:hypothetical protein